MSSDSYLGEGGSTVHDLQKTPKITRVCLGDAWFGLAGDPSSLGNAIWALEQLDLARFDLRRDLRHYMAKKEVPTEVDISALLCTKTAIFAVDDSWSAHPILRPYCAIGVGRDFAMGMLACLEETGDVADNPRGSLALVMKKTALMVDGVRAPFHYSKKE